VFGFLGLAEVLGKRCPCFVLRESDVVEKVVKLLVDGLRENES
jgi:hypothetical protein